MNSENMIRVSKQRPCPVCGKPDWCLIARDGSAAICARIAEGSVKQCGEAGWFRPHPAAGPTFLVFCDNHSKNQPY